MCVLGVCAVCVGRWVGVSVLGVSVLGECVGCECGFSSN